jgi:hydroxymethylbilane synthase
MARERSTIRIVTRKSPLAWQQASLVKQILQHHHPQLEIELIGLLTAGDKKPAQESIQFAGKSLFVKELQMALLNNQADMAVHSVKDLSVTPREGLTMTAVSSREDPRDAFISNHFANWQALPAGAIVGTTSPRRQCQLLALRPDINIKSLRGNVGTRLNYLDKGEYDAIILAYAGLKRLELEKRARQILDPDAFLPAIGQGALGIECRAEDTSLQKLITSVDDFVTHQCIKAERTVNVYLGGDCYTPIGAYAHAKNDVLYLQAMVGSLDGKTILKSQTQGSLEQAEQLGEQVAQHLLTQGAASLLRPF